MAWTERYSCDVCGKAKSEEVEDWWLAWSEKLSPTPSDHQQPVLKITRWNTFLSHDADAKHLCGARCAQTIMDRWMQAKNEEL
jgi:hypothetical protein